MRRKPTHGLVLTVVVLFLTCAIYQIKHSASMETPQLTNMFVFSPIMPAPLVIPLKLFEPPTDLQTAGGGAADSRRKFFHEIPGDSHLMDGIASYSITKSLEDREQRLNVLRKAFPSFHTFAMTHGFPYWLGFGTLLGQSRGEAIMPFDTDIDLCMPLGALHSALPLNRTLWEGRYWLDINPNYRNRTSMNVVKLNGPEPNKIDARWVDTRTGAFIDILAVAVDWAADPNEKHSKVPRLQDKSIWSYNHSEISPLQPCRFEGITSWCPAAKEAILTRTYKNGYTYGPHFHAWHLDATLRTWSKLSCRQLAQMYTDPSPEDCDEFCRRIVRFKRRMRWNDETEDPDHERCCSLRILWEEGGMRQLARFKGVKGYSTLPHLEAEYPPVVL